MGVNYSKYIPEIKKLPSNVCVLYLNTSAFYGINLPVEVIHDVGEVFRETWGKEIQIKTYCDTIMKFDLKSCLHFFSFQSDSAKFKLMFCKFHKLFYKHGWSLVSSPTLTFSVSLSSWFYFKYDNPFLLHDKKVENEFCAIGLSNTDGFQFINFPIELENPIINCIRQNWTKGTKNKKLIKDTVNLWSLQLNGFPWSCYGKQSVDARYLVLCLIRFMSHHNWRLVNSTAMKQDASDTMFFRSQSNMLNVDCPESMPEYYFMLALINPGSLSILGCDANLGQFIANSCDKYETKGSKLLYTKHNYVSLDLNSKVWSRRNEKETETRRLMTCLFQDLAAIGWIPTESIDCTRHITDLSSILFTRVPPVRMQYFCLCPRKYNGICLINAEEDVQTLIFNTFVEYYPIQRNDIKRSFYGVAYSIDFKGDAFRGSNLHGVILFQLALAAIISVLKDIGWYLLVSADTSNETMTVDENTEIKWSIYALWFCRPLPT